MLQDMARYENQRTQLLANNNKREKLGHEDEALGY